MNLNDMIKGIRKLEKLNEENERLCRELKILKDRLADYESEEVGVAMAKMGFTRKEALAAIAILQRSMQSVHPRQSKDPAT